MIPEEARDGIVALRWTQHGEILSIIKHILGFAPEKSIFAVRTQQCVFVC
jgi:hypothetical protein